MPGTSVLYQFFKENCEDPMHIQKVLIPDLKPEPKPKCSEDLGREACEEAGGTYEDSMTRSPFCDCP
jgi:hypothetical protein